MPTAVRVGMRRLRCRNARCGITGGEDSHAGCGVPHHQPGPSHLKKPGSSGVAGDRRDDLNRQVSKTPRVSGCATRLRLVNRGSTNRYNGEPVFERNSQLAAMWMGFLTRLPYLSRLHSFLAVQVPRKCRMNLLFPRRYRQDVGANIRTSRPLASVANERRCTAEFRR